MARFTVREIPCKTLINRVQGMPFNWSINPYRGCRHACVYCYARPTHQYLGLDGGEAFEEIIIAKINAPDAARRELGKRSWRRENVVIGTATDPYQQAESRYRLTRGILEAFRDFRNPVSITTKSPMILRDLDLLADLARDVPVTVHFTVTTLDERLWREIEPTTARPRKRLEALRTLRAHGIRAGIFLSPVLPGLTDDAGHLETVVAAAAEYGADFVFSQALRLGPGISEYYLPWLESAHPELAARYRRLYRHSSPPSAYSEGISALVRDLKQRYRLPDRPSAKGPAQEPPARQLRLLG
ncbi:MAG TPA: radical SAM protein [Chloroflexota bacterium]|nr:radical SAM protein [Chloroflexota bacterium]